MQNKTFQTFLFMSVLFFGVVSPQERAWGAEEYQGSLNCGFSGVTDADTSMPLVLEKGAANGVICEVTNTTKEKTLSVFVLGKQFSAGTLVASSGTNMTVSGETTVSGTISFPAAPQNGQYDYVFTAMDTKTGQDLTNEIRLKATIGGEVELGEVVFDTEGRQWGDDVDMTVFFKAPEKTVIKSDMFFLRVAMITKEGGECAVLEDKLAVTEAATKIRLDFPREEQCPNALRISLRDINGKVIDQKIVSAGPFENDISAGSNFIQNLFASMPKIFWIFLVLTGVLVLALVGYMMVRKKRF